MFQGELLYLEMVSGEMGSYVAATESDLGSLWGL